MSLTKEEQEFANWLSILDPESNADAALKSEAVKRIATAWMESRCTEDRLAKRVQAQLLRIESLESPPERPSAPPRLTIVRGGA